MAITSTRIGPFFDSAVRRLADGAWGKGLVRPEATRNHSRHPGFASRTNPAALQPVLNALLSYLGGSR